jgi:2-phosphoglycerate kinase
MAKAFMSMTTIREIMKKIHSPATSPLLHSSRTENAEL